MNTAFLKKYSNKIEGSISCIDRMIISGTLDRCGYVHAKELIIKEFNIIPSLTR